MGAVIACLQSLPATSILGLSAEYDIDNATPVQPPSKFAKQMSTAASRPGLKQQPASAIGNQVTRPGAVPSEVKPVSPPVQKPARTAAPSPSTRDAQTPTRPRAAAAAGTPPTHDEQSAASTPSRPVALDADLDELLGVTPPGPPFGRSVQQAHHANSSKEADASARRRPQAAAKATPSTAADDFDDFLKSL